MTATLHSKTIVTDPFVEYGVTPNAGTVALQNANDIAIYPFTLPYEMEITNIGVFIGVGDGSNDSDIGIYDIDGNLLGHVGAQHISSASAQLLALTGGPIVLGPGTYLLAFTSAATTLMWAVSDASYPLTLFSTSTSSSGGALPSTITVAQSISEDVAAPHSGYPPVMILT